MGNRLCVVGMSAIQGSQIASGRGWTSPEDPAPATSAPSYCDSCLTPCVPSSSDNSSRGSKGKGENGAMSSARVVGVCHIWRPSLTNANVALPPVAKWSRKIDQLSSSMYESSNLKFNWPACLADFAPDVSHFGMSCHFCFFFCRLVVPTTAAYQRLTLFQA